MKTNILLLVLSVILVNTTGCKKEEGSEVKVYIDKPFELSILDKAFFEDTAPVNGKSNRLKVYFDKIEDNRVFGSACSNIWGGSFAHIHSCIQLNSDTLVGLNQFFAGCLNFDEEYKEISAPKIDIGGYRLLLLKLSPWDKSEKNEKNYRVKYVIKRK